MSDLVFAEKDACRVQGWSNQVFRIVRFNLTQHTADIWGGPPGRASMRTVTTDRLRPAKRGDEGRLR